MLKTMTSPLAAALGEHWQWTEDPRERTHTARRDEAVYIIDSNSLTSCGEADAAAIAGALNRAVEAGAVGRVTLTVTRKGGTSSAVAHLVDGREV